VEVAASGFTKEMSEDLAAELLILSKSEDQNESSEASDEEKVANPCKEASSTPVPLKHAYYINILYAKMRCCV
jgi:hypothetical protein